MTPEVRVILLGPPGAGKGTQGHVICNTLSISHIATGDILRQAVANQTSLGKKAKEFMDAGELVPDELVIDLMRERLSEDDCGGGFLLDGFPRTVEQAKSLTEMLTELDRSITHVIDLKVSEEVLLERILKRAQEGAARSDDTGEIAQNRLKVYWEQTSPVSAYYKDLGTYRGVDGLGAVEEVSQRVMMELDQPIIHEKSAGQC